MTRSQMVYKIYNKIKQHKKIKMSDDQTLANSIVDFIEKEGMAPPEVFNGEYGAFAREWEPEEAGDDNEKK